MIKDVTASFDIGIAKIVSSEDYPNITAIDANDDYTQFTVTVSADKLGMVDPSSMLIFHWAENNQLRNV